MNCEPFLITTRHDTMYAYVGSLTAEMDVTAAINTIPGLVFRAQGAGCRRLRLDLSAMESSSSALLAALVIALACARGRDVELRISANGSLRAAAVVARLEHVLPIEGGERRCEKHLTA